MRDGTDSMFEIGHAKVIIHAVRRNQSPTSSTSATRLISPVDIATTLLKTRHCLLQVVQGSNFVTIAGDDGRHGG